MVHSWLSTTGWNVKLILLSWFTLNASKQTSVSFSNRFKPGTQINISIHILLLSESKATFSTCLSLLWRTTCPQQSVQGVCDDLRMRSTELTFPAVTPVRTLSKLRSVLRCTSVSSVRLRRTVRSPLLPSLGGAGYVNLAPRMSGFLCQQKPQTCCTLRQSISGLSTWASITFTHRTA